MGCNHDELRQDLGLIATWGLALPMSLVSGWMHEEWHRAVLARHAISSRNGIFYADAWSNGTISVDRVTDEDLAQLKKNAPADMVRLMSAGMESQHALSERVGDEAFFHGGSGKQNGLLYQANTWMAPTIVMNELNSLAYHATCAGEDSNTLTDQENRLRITTESRDFTGLDCVAWVYDLSRPDEPYADRGPHPYGEGIDRYRSQEDLSTDERALLKRVTRLHLLNLLNPHAYGINGFVLPGDDHRWIAQVGTVSNPFGYSISSRFGWKRGSDAYVFTLLHHFSEIGWSPGIKTELRDKPMGPHFRLGLGGAFWLQPADLRWDATQRQAGGQIQAEVTWRMHPRFDVWMRTSSKTEGWVLGEVYLQPAITGQAGVTTHIRGPDATDRLR
jgi:hypothetical protein